jgi:carboxyl-terminal processing protease
MKIKNSTLAILLALTITSIALPARAQTDMDKVSVSVARLLEQGHYSRQSLNADISKRLFERYLADLDPNRLFFIEPDVEEFRLKYESSLDQNILSGNLDPAREIFARYKERVEARAAKNLKLADKKYDFKSERTVALDRKESPWPKDAAEADQLWADRIEAELLEESLNEHATDAPPKVIARRQNQILRNVNDLDDEAIVAGFLSALARTYDPHTTYMSPSELESFRIEMEKSLEGVGAVLSSEDGYTKVREIVPGGPADLQGNLRVSDRIVAVAQGEKEFEDIVDMRLDKVVQKIRGKRGTIVRLQVIPANVVDASKREVIAIRRDKVELKDQKAKAELLDMKGQDGRNVKIGWVEVPSFYANSDEGVSTAGDVLSLINRLKKEDAEGLVIDLRRDGGGSLDEAIKLTGLFIPKGPVVLSKDSNGKVSVSNDLDPGLAYNGPIVVLMNRLSASASEIFAAALQDYGVAVIVGDERSFGKGTVQTMLDIGRFMPIFSLGAADAGALKLTINKYYRVRGGSTQLEGVRSDIIIPSLTDNPEIGEGALPNALPYDEVAPQRIETDPMMASMLPELQNRSAARVASDPEFSYILEDMTRLRQRIEENTVSLNLAKRKSERDADTARKEARISDRKERGPAFEVTAYELTLENVEKPELVQVAFDRDKKKGYDMEVEETKDEEPKDPAPDAVRNEALRIAGDLIEVRAASKTASIQKDTPVVQ